MSSNIKSDNLKNLIKEIVKSIYKEMTTTSAASPVSTPNCISKKNKDDIDEMTTTSNVDGYNVPSAFSSRGGSESGVKGSQKLGYDLTPIGKKEMNRPADRL